MNINLISFNKLLVRVDECSDYIPGVSSLTNLCCIFQKGLLSLTDRKDFVENSYVFHVYHKNLARCLIACMPILGNIILAIYDDQIDDQIVEAEKLPKTFLIKQVKREIRMLCKKHEPCLKRLDQLPENQLPEGGRAVLAPEFFVKFEQLIKRLQVLDPENKECYRQALFLINIK